ncbi:MAG: gliding motility-associated C-terminal domain-containing protein [Bacteroidia bacterium]
MGISAKDSSAFSHVSHYFPLGAGLFGQGIFDSPNELQVYIPNGNAIELVKNGGTSFLINGPQYYAILKGEQIRTGQTDTCLFVYGLKVNYDTVNLAGIKSYHSNVHKIRNSAIQVGDSVNSILHRRLYFQNTPRCFNIELMRRDTVHPLRCESYAKSAVALLPPSAKRLSIDDHYCYGYDFKVIEFNLENTKPGCMSSFVQFNPDFKNDSNDWNLLNDINYGDMRRNVFLNPNPPYRGYDIEGPNSGKFYWVYNDTLFPKTSIQEVNVALIVGNGLAPSMCLDTVYYSNFASFPRLTADIVFADNQSKKHNVCSDTTVFVSIPNGTFQSNSLANYSSWYNIYLQTGDTLEKYDETYHWVLDHPNYPGKKVNYTILERYKFQNQMTTLVQTDTIVTAIVHQYKAIALPGIGLNILKNQISQLGFDNSDLPDSVILDLIWNNVGTIGLPASGSKGCIDTTGFGDQIKYYYRIHSSSILNYKDSSYLPADSFLLNGKRLKAYPFKVKKNGSYQIFREVGSYFPSYCPVQEHVNLAVGFDAKVSFSDTIVCQGRIVEATPEFRYYNIDSLANGDLDTLDYWTLRRGQAGSTNREGLTIWDYSKEDDSNLNTATIFGAFPYAKIGYGSPGILLGNELNGIYYKSPGIYTLRVLAKDSNQCTDTIQQKLYITGPKAGFYTDIVTPNCKTILEFFDTSKIVDPCEEKGLPPCDFIYKWTIDWGDGTAPLEYLKQLPKQIGHDYTSNGFYRITLIIESILGCKDTVSQDVFIPGPGPKFIPETPIVICVNDSVKFRNESANFTASSQWLWNFGDGYYSPQIDTTSLYHQYTVPGLYDVYLSQYDSIANTGKYCAAVYPDVGNGQAKITIRVLAYDQVKLNAKPLVVCVGDTIHLEAELISDNTYFNYYWTINGTLNKNKSLKYDFVPNKKGAFNVSWAVDTGLFTSLMCPAYDSIVVYADSVFADFDIDDSQLPTFCFNNMSQYAVSYRWGYFHDADITKQQLEFKENAKQFEPERSICQSFLQHPGKNWVCLEATNALGCKDTICKEVNNDYQIGIKPPNVFTPLSKDGFEGLDDDGLKGNNQFNIYVKNVDFYKLIIYDRWGVEVFRSDNSEHDWNGRVQNTGNDCPAGTYYYILEYRYRGFDKNEPSLNGVVRLIR